MGQLGSGVQQILIFAVHGFLGEASDWSMAQNELEPILKNKIKWVAPSLFSSASLPVVNLNEVPGQLIKFYQNEFQILQPRIFIGYSLGARLGIHFLNNYASYFDQFIFVSAHPGLLSEKEKEQRKFSDQQWADLITEVGWNQFLSKWNAQAVFNSTLQDPVREKDRFDLQKLQTSLDFWSLSRQSDTRSLLTQYQEKITWVVGTEDAKYLELATDLKQKKILLDFNRISAGHRILFQNPLSLANLIAQIISKLKH